LVVQGKGLLDVRPGGGFAESEVPPYVGKGHGGN
jgi:hypothetical protein